MFYKTVEENHRIGFDVKVIILKIVHTKLSEIEKCSCCQRILSVLTIYRTETTPVSASFLNEQDAHGIAKKSVT